MGDWPQSVHLPPGTIEQAAVALHHAMRANLAEGDVRWVDLSDKTREMMRAGARAAIGAAFESMSNAGWAFQEGASD